MDNVRPHIYTLPQQFIDDDSVPLRWKVYSIINGFWISGKPVFASNAYFAHTLGCTERHVQKCFENLEVMRVIQRIGISQNRLIVPWGTNSADTPQDRGTNSAFVGGTNSADTRISDSISDRNTSERAEDGAPEGGVPKPKSKPARKSPFRGYDENSFQEDGLPSLDLDSGEEIEEAAPAKRSRTGPASEIMQVFAIFDDIPAKTSWGVRPLERDSAKILLGTYGIEELRKRYAIVKKYRDDPYCPAIYSPSAFLEKMPNMESFLKKL